MWSVPLAVSPSNSASSAISLPGTSRPPTSWRVRRRPMSNPSEQPDVADDAPTNGGIKPGKYYGRSIPYLPINGYPGKLIAVEGTDGVGRSTQIQLLREWLEVKGYGVVETGWTRSPLMQPTIELAKSSNTLNKLTFVLLYATDFADRLEKEIIPALKAGFVVLTDRYIFTALARAGVRGG